MESYRMASPGELVKTVSEVLGVPEPSVTVHDRNLVTANLRKKGGRGRSAAAMSAWDAANLLIGVAASSSVKDTVRSVEEYSKLPSHSAEASIAAGNGMDYNAPTNWGLVGFPLPALQSLPADHTFRDALMALLLSATDGSIERAYELSGPFSDAPRVPRLLDMRVTFWGPYPQAAITIHCTGFREKHVYELGPPVDAGGDELRAWSEQLEPVGDLTQLREFTQATIRAVGDLLKT